MISAWLFILGTAFGSFVNVLSSRYDSDKFLFKKSSFSGRSHCENCEKKLSWYELIPLVSFIFQLWKCSSCKAKLSLQYPAVELISGLLFVFIPLRVLDVYYLLPNSSYYLLSTLWISVFLLILVMSLIDLRTFIIPDEINLLLLLTGIVIAFVGADYFGIVSGSFVGPHSLIAGFRENIWLNRGVATLFSILFFGGIIALGRGRWMGLGDLKLAIPLGLIFGWPDIIILSALSFFFGAVFGLAVIFLGKFHFKRAVPFGPFLAMGSAAVYFFGDLIVSSYFGLFPII